ncbi:cytidine deaminase [Jatrophihabitans sp. DSM 45814]
MTDQPDPQGKSGTELDPEDAKLVTLARATRARSSARQGAAVRDTDGRTYAAASVALPSLELSALQVAVAMAVSSGAPGLEAAVVVADQPGDSAGAGAVHDVAPAVSIFFFDINGNPAG